MKQLQLLAFLVMAVTPALSQNVGIGTNTPQSRLQVAGKITADSIRITGGAAAGKILSSTADGDAIWATPSFISTGLNGLERKNDTLQLGGSLVRATTINTDGNRLNITKRGDSTSGIMANNMLSSIQYVIGDNFQTFEVFESCRLDSIRVYLYSIGATSCVARLYEGQDTTSNYLATTVPFSYPAYPVATPYKLVFPNVNLEANKKYTIRLINGAGWVINSGNLYPYGQSNFGNSYDFLFVVYGTYLFNSGLVVRKSGEVNIRGRLSLSNQTALELGEGEIKGPNAGIIAYRLFTPDAVDIVGAGTDDNNRKIKFWAQGGSTFAGPVNVLGGGTFTAPINAVLQQDSVQAPALLNGWVNHGGGFANAGFWKDREGMVHIKGLIKSGNIATSTILFVLPADYRPAERLIFNVNANNVFGRVDVLPSGEVIIAVISSNAFLNLDGILFRTN